MLSSALSHSSSPTWIFLFLPGIVLPHLARHAQGHQDTRPLQSDLFSSAPIFRTRLRCVEPYSLCAFRLPSRARTGSPQYPQGGLRRSNGGSFSGQPHEARRAVLAPSCTIVVPSPACAFGTPTTALEFREMLPEDHEASVVDKTHLGRHNVKCSQHSVYVMHIFQTGSKMFRWRLSTCRHVLGPAALSSCSVKLWSTLRVPRTVSRQRDRFFSSGTLVLVTSSSTMTACILGYNTVQRITTNTTQIQRTRLRKETIQKEKTSRRWRKTS